MNRNFYLNYPFEFNLNTKSIDYSIVNSLINQLSDYGIHSTAKYGVLTITIDDNTEYDYVKHLLNVIDPSIAEISNSIFSYNDKYFGRMGSDVDIPVEPDLESDKSLEDYLKRVDAEYAKNNIEEFEEKFKTICDVIPGLGLLYSALKPSLIPFMTRCSGFKGGLLKGLERRQKAIDAYNKKLADDNYLLVVGYNLNKSPEFIKGAIDRDINKIKMDLEEMKLSDKTDPSLSKKILQLESLRRLSGPELMKAAAKDPVYNKYLMYPEYMGPIKKEDLNSKYDSLEKLINKKSGWISPTNISEVQGRPKLNNYISTNYGIDISDDSLRGGLESPKFDNDFRGSRDDSYADQLARFLSSNKGKKFINDMINKTDDPDLLNELGELNKKIKDGSISETLLSEVNKAEKDARVATKYGFEYDERSSYKEKPNEALVLKKMGVTKDDIENYDPTKADEEIIDDLSLDKDRYAKYKVLVSKTINTDDNYLPEAIVDIPSIIYYTAAKCAYTHENDFDSEKAISFIEKMIGKPRNYFNTESSRNRLDDPMDKDELKELIGTIQNAFKYAKSKNESNSKYYPQLLIITLSTDLHNNVAKIRYRYDQNGFSNETEANDWVAEETKKAKSIKHVGVLTASSIDRDINMDRIKIRISKACKWATDNGYSILYDTK